jgi:hypothetical protein
MRALPITGEYPPDWPAIGDATRERAGHRCIRCRHPYRVGQQGSGEWSPCDAQCRHVGPFGYQYRDGDIVVDESIQSTNAGERASVAIFIPGRPRLVAQWRILTVHHLDGNKANGSWWNLLALCQRCHLQIQCRVNPDQPWLFEHSEWFRPYVAGFYAKKYLGVELTREEVEQRLEELLALERQA